MYQQQAVERDQRQPLLLGEEESFVSYDDDDLAAAARLRKKRARWVNFDCTVTVF